MRKEKEMKEQTRKKKNGIKRKEIRADRREDNKKGRREEERME